MPSRTKRVLIVDDEPDLGGWLGDRLSERGFEVRVAERRASAEALASAWRPDAVLLDLVLPDVDGLELLEWLRAGSASPEVVVMSGQGSIATAVEAIKRGASYFLEKPLQIDTVAAVLERAIERTGLAAENLALRRQLADRYQFENIVGRSAVMRELFALVAAVADSEANILIQGENGTGKELIANAIHFHSPRARGPFIKINCAAIPKDLIESELFGYRRGAFTGAMSDKEGLLELADGGSLLLDEVGEMPPYLQTKLLRVLQERSYRPVGGDRQVRVNFRLVCATNVDLDVALRDGRLREDLYFRINTIALRVPPLRERPDDIPPLCDFFLERFRRRYQRAVLSISPAAYRLLMRGRWPGNVRELENAIERAVLMARGPEITPADLPESLDRESSPGAFAVPSHRTLAEIERMAIVQALQRTNWNKQEAALQLGLYRPTLYSKMRKHRIQDERPARRARAAEPGPASIGHDRVERPRPGRRA